MVDIVSCTGPVEKSNKRFKRLFSGMRPRYLPPEISADHTLFMLTRKKDDDITFDRIESDSERLEYEVSPDSRFYRVFTGPIEICYVLPRMLKSSDDFMYDLRIEGTLRIANPGDFLKKVAYDYVKVEDSFDESNLETWLFEGRLKQPLTDEFEDRTVEEYRQENSHPSKWWLNTLNTHSEACGFGFRQVSAEPVNEDVDELRANEERYRLQQEQLKSQKRIAELEKEREKMHLEHQEELEKVKHVHRKNKYEREQKLGLLEKEYQRKMAESQREIEEAKKSSRIASIKYDEILAEYEDNKELLEKTKKRLKELEQEYAESRGRLDKLMAFIKKSVPGLFARFVSDDPLEKHQGKESAVSPEHDMEPWMLASMGYSITQQMVVEAIRQKRQKDGAKVSISKSFSNRDIGNKKVKAIRVDQSLAFKVNTERSGYLTILNLGTSGDYFVHVPNIWVGPGEARVTSGQTYRIPGDDHLPLDKLGGYYEMGPSGWEHLAAIVSTTPIVDDALVSRGSDENPIVKLTEDETEALLALLSQLDPESWSCDVVSFLVS